MAHLTVLIPCKNERQHIAACIESARAVADEILVADSGSTDGTLDIVRNLGGCRIIEREFIGFGDFKNWAIPQAKHEWVFLLDADERITPELAAEIERTVPHASPHLDMYLVPRRNYFMGHEIRHCGWGTDHCQRLIRRDECRFAHHRVHERFVVPANRTGRLQGKLQHYTFGNYHDFFRKHLKYAELWARDAWDEGHRATWTSLLLRPTLRFLHLYLVQRGFLDGLAGLQTAMACACVTFIKQAYLWEWEHAKPLRVWEVEQAGDQSSESQRAKAA